MIQIDVNSVIGVVLGGLLITLLIGLVKFVVNVNKLVQIIGSLNPPEGLLGQVSGIEKQVSEMRDWLLQLGYDRRKNKRDE